MQNIQKDKAIQNTNYDDRDNTPSENKSNAQKEENFFKLFGIILVLIVFYLPFLSTFMVGGHLGGGDSILY